MIKDEWSPPEEEDIIVEKKPQKKRGRPKGSSTPIIPHSVKIKLQDLEYKEKNLEKCIREKDRRIRDIENRWETTKEIVGVISILVIFFVVGGFLLHQGITNPELMNGAFAFIGMITTIFIICWIVIYILYGIAEGFDDDEICFAATLCAGFLTVIVIFVMVMSQNLPTMY